ncbi:carboxymuconolactone decarboxylase family protein, partial [Salmonella enterica subsp. enterica]|nr:carboxymuconolactone decarboxylase family protein [Salmonella enterica subsp. enterica]
MLSNWNEYRSGLLAAIGKFATLQPEFMKGFQQMDKGTLENGHLDPKTQELIAL